ncbi:unnamed protein product [Notodromas monacha]|uniref:Serine/threonine-protein kinase tousled-like 2 n=1 Tax=Notodromas monacha TaxID=399045 RepID=A0A7R9BCU1_9CRUS|nr:unnamed protein product [Notodromas monacha]CAG0912418.1 unnamed protein product [Notodromas monacha]
MHVLPNLADTNLFPPNPQAKVESEKKLSASTKTEEVHKKQLAKCVEVVKRLLVEKSTIEKKEIRRKCMQNRLRLGQFVTQRVGATYQENWQDGYAFQELSKRQENMQQLRESIDRLRKTLSKKKEGTSVRKKPSSLSTSTTGNNSNSNHTWASSGGNSSGSNSNDSFSFLKPDAPAKECVLTQQEHYEKDEILKLRANSYKKEDAALQLEVEKLERERNLHIRELKRISNEDQSRFKDHPVLCDRYLLLMLLGKGGFSEVHKVRVCLRKKKSAVLILTNYPTE